MNDEATLNERVEMKTNTTQNAETFLQSESK